MLSNDKIRVPSCRWWIPNKETNEFNYCVKWWIPKICKTQNWVPSCQVMDPEIKKQTNWDHCVKWWIPKIDPQGHDWGKSTIWLDLYNVPVGQQLLGLPEAGPGSPSPSSSDYLNHCENTRRTPKFDGSAATTNYEHNRHNIFFYSKYRKRTLVQPFILDNVSRVPAIGSVLRTSW
jgi:hypothetical protein